MYVILRIVNSSIFLLQDSWFSRIDFFFSIWWFSCLVYFVYPGVLEGMKQWWGTSFYPSSKSGGALCYQTTKKWQGKCPPGPTYSFTPAINFYLIRKDQKSFQVNFNVFYFTLNASMFQQSWKVPLKNYWMTFWKCHSFLVRRLSWHGWSTSKFFRESDDRNTASLHVHIWELRTEGGNLVLAKF